MSREKMVIVGNRQFVNRLIEVCGVSKPGEIAQLLDISYQAARNYLEGRFPETKVLIDISKKTTCSIHWLLTGEGNKFVTRSGTGDKPFLSDQMRTLIKKECSKAVGEILDNQFDTATEKVLVFKAEDIKEERTLEESSPVSLRHK